MRSTILGWILFLLASSVEAAPPPLLLEECQDFCLLGKYMEILEDKKGKLTIEEVLSAQTASRFVLSQLDAPNLGPTHSVYWVRFTLKNRTPENRQRWLVLHPFMIRVNLYAMTETGTYEMVQSGSSLSMPQREIDHIRPIIKLNIPPHQSRVYYLKIRAPVARLRLELWSQSVGHHNRIYRHLYQLGHIVEGI